MVGADLLDLGGIVGAVWVPMPEKSPIANSNTGDTVSCQVRRQS